MECDKGFDCCFDEETDVENVIMNGGATFVVKYIGCVEIVTSMKVLDFESRSQVAKECIHRVCDAAAYKSPRKRRVEKRIQQCVAATPCLEPSGVDVVLTISSDWLQLVSIETNEVVARHEMPNISFASGGDSESTSFVAYVAKDVTDWRACYVLDCGTDKSECVIQTLARAFVSRYKNSDAESRSTMKRNRYVPTPTVSANSNMKCDTEYYNDLPGKVPPEFSETSSSTCDRRRDRLHSNLIDLNTSIDYVNDEVQLGAEGMSFNNNIAASMSSGTSRDVFDMQCFSLCPEVQHSQLLLENWYHGPINRTISESLLRIDGDFLVRESQGSKGQYVLTGQNAGQPKHLLLIDPDGCVRTKDRVFENISHLINYHWTNRLPIISADSALLLRTPVLRTMDLRK